jgi:hypothetical protein
MNLLVVIQRIFIAHYWSQLLLDETTSEASSPVFKRLRSRRFSRECADKPKLMVSMQMTLRANSYYRSRRGVAERQP